MEQPAPRVGDGATISFVSDCYPATVVLVNKTGRIVIIQHDAYKVVSGSMLDGSAKYRVEVDRNNRLEMATRGRDGTYRTEGGQRVSFGYRRVYRDPMF